ncbi:MAG: ubiquinol-cytochrome c reductase iron-sulfur subunit [Isosphaeraceae bacterium]
MDEKLRVPVGDKHPVDRPSEMPRRGFLGVLSVAVGGLFGLVLAVPGAAYVLSPLRKRGREGSYQALTRLSQLEVGKPRSFAIIEERQDAWVKYPREPVGSVWLIRQPKGSGPEVIAMTSECPHLGCAVNLTEDGRSFLCPCHTSTFDLTGKPENQVPPRPMDRLDVDISKDEDPEIRVKFERFRSQSEERIPLV